MKRTGTSRDLELSYKKRPGPLLLLAEAKRCIKRITPLYQQAGEETPEFSEPTGRQEYAFKEALSFFTKTIGKPE